MDKIIIKQSYFDNIKTAVDSINQFFDSALATKNFPTDTTDLDWEIANIIKLMEDLDPSYVSDNQKYEDTIEMIADKINENGSISNQEIMADRQIRNAIQSIISFSALSFIADHFISFDKFINGIYTFELFLNPSKYRAHIELFTSPLQLPGELEDLDIDTAIFDVSTWVTNLFNNPDITFPDTMNQDKEVQRILEYRDAQNTEVVVDDKVEAPNPEQQESVNEYYMMEEYKDEPIEKTKTGTLDSVSYEIKNVKYDASTKRFQISAQCKSAVDTLIANLRKCNDVKDLKDFMAHFKPDKFLDIPYPYIIVQALSKRLKENGFDILKLENSDIFAKKKKQKSANRFANYSIYDTFKIDKDGTIKYIEDYFRMNLVNDPRAAITNNIVLALFNIFDSRMYLESVYRTKDNSLGKKQNQDSNSFVETVRGRINKNSRSTNVYQNPASKTVGVANATSKNIQESIALRLKDFGDITVEETQICESFKQILHDEISTISDEAYNNSMSASELDDFIDEAYVIMERDWYKHRPAAKGAVPDYMLSRMDLSDGEPQEPVQVADPLQEPDNSVNDLADSIDDKMDMPGGIDELMGSKFKPSEGEGKHITYNVTYNNSFNKTSNDMSSNVNSHNTTNDLSEGKSSSKTTNKNSHNTTNDLSEGKSTTNTTTNTNSNNQSNSNNSTSTTNSNNKTKSNSHSNNTTKTKSNSNSNNTTKTDSDNDRHDTTDRNDKTTTIERIDNVNVIPGKKKKSESADVKDIDPEIEGIDTEENSEFDENYPSNNKGKNNIDNSNDSLDTKDDDEPIRYSGDRKLSNGMSVEEMFTFLESEEPLSDEGVTVDTKRKPPTADSLTRAMDKDRESLSRRQEAKKRLQKFGNTARAKLRPITRTKKWMTNVVNSLVERDENKVKEEIIENPSYRTSLYKALRLAVKLGLTGVAFTVSGWLGAAVGTYYIAKGVDKNRLRREVQDEMVTELKIMDEKIDYAKEKGNQQELYKLMRLKGKMETIAADASRGRWKEVAPKRRWY